MDKGGYLIYKCRRCGELVKLVYVGKPGYALMCLLRDRSNLFKEPLLNTYNKLEHHQCKDGHLGVTDLIGCEIDKEEPNG